MADPVEHGQHFSGIVPQRQVTHFDTIEQSFAGLPIQLCVRLKLYHYKHAHPCAETTRFAARSSLLRPARTAGIQLETV